MGIVLAEQQDVKSKWYNDATVLAATNVSSVCVTQASWTLCYVYAYFYSGSIIDLKCLEKYHKRKRIALHCESRVVGLSACSNLKEPLFLVRDLTSK